MSISTKFQEQMEKDELLAQRDELIYSLNTFDIPESEKRFIVKKIQDITEKVLKEYDKYPFTTKLKELEQNDENN